MQPALPVGRHPVRKVLDAAHEYLGVVRLAALAPTLASGPRNGQDGAEECQVEEDGSVGRDLERQERGRVEDCQEEEDGCERAGNERNEAAAAPNRKTSARSGYRRARGTKDAPHDQRHSFFGELVDVLASDREGASKPPLKEVRKLVVLAEEPPRLGRISPAADRGRVLVILLGPGRLEVRAVRAAHHE